MAAVAERAGVSRRAVYLHFPSRASLINGVVEDLKGAGGLDEVLRPVWESPDALTMLDEWARCIASLLPRIMPIVRAIQRVSHTDPDAARHWEEATRSRHAACRRLAERLARGGAPGTALDGRLRRRHDARPHLLRGRSRPCSTTARWPPDRLADAPRRGLLRHLHHPGPARPTSPSSGPARRRSLSASRRRASRPPATDLGIGAADHVGGPAVMRRPIGPPLNGAAQLRAERARTRAELDDKNKRSTNAAPASPNSDQHRLIRPRVAQDADRQPGGAQHIPFPKRSTGLVRTEHVDLPRA